jgi:hypothetical protein
MLHLTFLINQEGAWFNCQCLEYDLGSCAKTKEDAIYEIQKTIMAQFSFQRKFLNDYSDILKVTKPPDEYQNMEGEKINFKLIINNENFEFIDLRNNQSSNWKLK